MRKILLVHMLLISTMTFAQSTYSRYDINHDGKVTIEDVTALTNRLIGKINYPVTSITLSKTEASLYAGETLDLTATVLPSDADDTTLTWSSSDESIATVTEGVITAVSPGNVSIYVTANDGSGISATCEVIVKKAYEAVDLGLSVKWATINVGASSPEESGLYFAWGETSGYTQSDGHIFNYENYTLCGRTYTYMLQYCTNSSYGIVDNLRTLQSWSDAATANWGSTWRMPTLGEWIELAENCEWLYLSNGFKITASNGNSIFLPLSGECAGDEFLTGGIHYWSSSLGNLDYLAYYIYWDVDDGPKTSDTSRCYGLSVRPVCP